MVTGNRGYYLGNEEHTDFFGWTFIKSYNIPFSLIWYQGRKTEVGISKNLVLSKSVA